MGALEGKTAIVTGAGRGIGREIALMAASRGGKGVVNDLGGSAEGEGGDKSVAEQVVDEIRKAGGQAIANGDSVADPAAAENIVKSAVQAFGRIDCVVNNACGAVTSARAWLFVQLPIAPLGPPMYVGGPSPG